MSLIGKFLDDVFGDAETTETEQSRTSLDSSNAAVAAEQIADTAGAIVNRIITDPKGTVDDVLNDMKVSVFGHHGVHPIQDAVNFAKGVITVGEDVVTNIFNLVPSTAATPTYERQANAVSAGSNVVINSKFTTGASIGDMSWLIYKGRMVSNPEITDKWKLYKDVETTHGFNSRTYINEKDKQVVITLEGTQSNSDLSPLWLSKDGLSDLEIGLGVIPPQMREGYEQFKTVVADVMNNYVSDGYSISVAGHSLGGGLAQMMPGMYFIDTGVALPTLAEAGPGMLSQLKIYAEQQLLAGKEIHLPSGNVVSLSQGTLLERANEAKAIVGTFKAQDFSFVTNLITVLDPVGAVNYNIDPDKDGHVGLNMIVPYLLTTREDMQNLESVVMDPINHKNIVTPELTDKLGLGGIHATRFDRHEPDQSIVLWSGTAVGFKDPSRIGVGSAVYRDYLAPRKVWDGSNLSLPQTTVFGSKEADLITTNDRPTQVLAGDGNDVVRTGNGGNLVSGGNGDDYIIGGSGDDYLAGDAGADNLYGGKGNDILYGGEGNDYLDGGEGSDLLFGGAGDDTLVWSTGNDILGGNEGNDTLVVRNGATGNAQMKWERNFTNFGQDKVVFEGAMAKDSTLLLNFADEIRFQDMKWSVNGDDIVMTDNLGNAAASVTFSNAFNAFDANSGKVDFQFTNGKLYVDDQKYAVQAGHGTVKASDDSAYAGSFMVGSAGNDTLVSGKGNDLMFGGKGSNTFVFDNSFGHDTIVGSNSKDVIKFNTEFNAKEYTISADHEDLVISYQQSGLNTSSTLTLSNWYAGGDHADTFSFNNGTYKAEGTSFVRK